MLKIVYELNSRICSKKIDFRTQVLEANWIQRSCHKTKYNKAIKTPVIFNLIFVITAFVLIPIIDMSEITKNVTLGTFTGVDVILLLLIILKPEKMNKASGTLLFISFAAVFTVIFKWAEGLI